MTIINNNTVVVFDSSELKEVLEKNNDYNYIYFGNNITLTNGIKINNNKTNLIIDGTYQNTMYEYIDQKKLGSSDGIYLSSNNTTKVIVKNMTITGYNYYGIIFVPDNINYQNTVIEYKNIAYTGPQLSFNPYGTTRIIDSVINIETNYAAGNEVAECNKIELGGYTNIVHKSTGNSSFWFRNNNPTLTILDNSLVYFTSISRELFYGVNNLLLIVGKNSSFYINTAKGMGYSTYGTGKTLIEENGLLSIKQTTRNGNNPTWNSYDTITVNKNATLDIIIDYQNITTTNYNIYFRNNSGGLILNNPEKVILYNSGTNVINTNNNISFDFTYSRINLFNNAININSDISKDNLPTYSWYKKDELSTINGNFNSNTTTIINNNYTDIELTTLPDLSNFNITNKQIISIGTFPFTVSPITDKSLEIHGLCNSYDSILIEYNSISTIVIADEYGNFNYSYDTTLPVGTKITFNVKKYEDLLYYTKTVEIVYSGELTLDSATKYFKFEVYAINLNPILCPRLDTLNIIVTDSRINSSDWRLYATINQDLTSKDGKVLKNSLVYVSEDNEITVLSNTPTLVYTGYNNEGMTTKTLIEWEEDKGILLQVNDYIENNTEYFAEITWILEE